MACFLAYQKQMAFYAPEGGFSIWKDFLTPSTW